MSTVQVPNLPGLTELGEGFLERYAAMVQRNGWDPAGIVTVLSYESGLNPHAQLSTTDTKTGERGKCLELESPKHCSAGLLQWNKVGLGEWAAAHGLSFPVTIMQDGQAKDAWRGNRRSLEQIAGMSAVEQLPLIEDYYKASFDRHGIDGRKVKARDFGLVALGYPTAIGKPDSYPLLRSMDRGGDAKENDAYKANRALDVDDDGIITAGDLRARWDKALRRAEGKLRVQIHGQASAPRVGAFLLPALLGGFIFYKTVR
jgi:hypothetical protein